MLKLQPEHASLSYREAQYQSMELKMTPYYAKAYNNVLNIRFCIKFSIYSTL
uniref:Uncharacterized protein n=1 Tax=Arundo donax TaxID=35708 RepID=A0A0A8YPD6_ARUDO